MQDLMPDISASQLPKFIKTIWTLDRTMAPMLWGPPGIGKTETVFQARDLIQEEFGIKINVLVMIASQMESSDLSIPWVYPTENGEVTYRKVPIKDLIFEKGEYWFLFLDELTAGTPEVQKAFQNLLSARRIGDLELPDTVMIIAAGNRKEDRAGSLGLFTAVANRLINVNVTVDPRGWQAWAKKNNINFKVRAYLHQHSDHLFDFDPRREINATPRVWVKASKWVDAECPFLTEGVGGLVGMAKATTFTTFAKLFDELPMREDIIANPLGCKLPKDRSYQVALAFSIIEWMTKENRDALITYLGRMGLEHETLVFRTLKDVNVEMLIGNKQFTEWARLNQDLMTGN